MTAAGDTLEKQIKSLIRQNKYAAAVRKLQQGLKRNPAQTVAVSEADIRLLQGKYEFERSQYTQAQKSLQQALELGLYDDTYYWLAKCLMAQAKHAEALTLFQSAFENKTLYKDMGGCYLKLLLLNDQADEVQQLIETKANRFYAPHLHWARKGRWHLSPESIRMLCRTLRRSDGLRVQAITPPFGSPMPISRQATGPKLKKSVLASAPTS